MTDSLSKYIILSSFLTGWLSISNSQSTIPAATHSFRSQQQQFLSLNYKALDSLAISQLQHFVKTEAENLHNSITSDITISKEDKINAIISLGSFIEGLGDNLLKDKAEFYDLPNATASFKDLLTALVYQQPYDHLMAPLTPQRAQLLANSVYKFREYPRIRDQALYKRIISSPQYILQYVQMNPGYRYVDSLLLFAAADDPWRMAYYLQNSKSGLRFIIRNKSNPYIRQIVMYAEHPSAEDILPFIAPLAEGKLTVDQILQKRPDVDGYFQLLVNTLKELVNHDCTACVPFQSALRKGIKEKAIAFYVDRINEAHSEPPQQRFAPIKNLRPEDIYYVITSAEQELYTSSYLGLYRKLMEYCQKNATDSLFRKVNYDQFRVFMRMAANYNTLNDFFSCLPTEVSKVLLHKFSDGIGEDAYDALGRAMDLSDTFTGLAKDSVFNDLLKKELQQNLLKNKKERHALGITLYSILWQVYELVDNNEHGLLPRLGNYQVLPRKRLQNYNGEIIELVLFYGDEDGQKSYNSFLSIHNDTVTWQKTDSSNWIRFRSKNGQPVIIYANKPLDHGSGEDLRAQVELYKYLQEKSLYPVILVHRGHSYFLENSLTYLNSTIKLALLGSCGGSNNLISVASISPDSHIIVSKKIGTLLVNDPLLAMINNWLVQKKDLVWPDIWKAMEEKFKNDPNALNLFSEYIPPSKNISLFVMKLFNLPGPPVK